MFACVALAYLSVWPYFEQVNNPNENVRVYMTRAIVESHTMAIDGVSERWGWVNDKATAGGRLYSSKAPGASLLGVPVLWAETGVWHLLGWGSPSKRACVLGLRLGATMLPMLAFLFLFARWAERICPVRAWRDLALLGLGCGTLLYPYGILFVGHALGAAAAGTSYLLLSWPASDASERKRTWRWVGAGAAAGTAVLFEYQLAFAAVVLAGYAGVAGRRRALWFIAGAVPLAVALGAYHTALFGKPWAFPYGHLENASYAAIHHAGMFGLGKPRLNALGTSLFSISYGLFVFSPFLLLGVLAAVDLVRRGARRAGVLFLAVATLMALFLAGMSQWRGGWCVGPRYIAGVAPFLVAALVRWRASRPTPDALAQDAREPSSAMRDALPFGVLGGLVIASVFLNGISTAVYPHYPEQFDNPVFDLALPLLRHGYVPLGLGWALHLPRLWSLLPVATFWLAAALLALAGGAATPRTVGLRVGLAALLALVYLVPLSRYGRGPSASERAAAATVQRMWDPPPRRPAHHF